MKTKKFLLSGILGIALAGVVLTGCHKTSTAPTTNTDTTAAQDDANATEVANDSKEVSDAAVSSSGHTPFKFRLYYNATIRFDTSSTTDSLIINFSDSVVCYDNRYRKGEIIVTWPNTGKRPWWQVYHDSGATITETFVGYTIWSGTAGTSSKTVSGTRTWTNGGINTAGFQNWNFTANLKLTYPNGKTATWISARNCALELNGVTWYYVITGTLNSSGEAAYGVSSGGDTYAITIAPANPVYYTALPWWLGGCAWVEAGDLTITRTGKPTITVNLGTVGACSPFATATMNGVTYTIAK